MHFVYNHNVFVCTIYILYVVWFTIFTLVTSQLISWRKKISQLELNSLHFISPYAFVSFSSFPFLFFFLS